MFLKTFFFALLVISVVYARTLPQYQNEDLAKKDARESLDTSEYFWGGFGGPYGGFGGGFGGYGGGFGGYGEGFGGPFGYGGYGRYGGYWG